MRLPKKDPQQVTGLFARYIWFYVLFFIVLMMIASFGLIAEA
jgi:hypothetical protein